MKILQIFSKIAALLIVVNVQSPLLFGLNPSNAQDFQNNQFYTICHGSDIPKDSDLQFQQEQSSLGLHGQSFANQYATNLMQQRMHAAAAALVQVYQQAPQYVRDEIDRAIAQEIQKEKEEELRIEQAKQEADKKHLDTFGITAESLEILYDYPFEGFTRFILAHDKLSREQVIQLAQGYCKHNYFRDKKIEYFFNEALNAFDKGVQKRLDRQARNATQLNKPTKTPQLVREIKQLEIKPLESNQIALPSVNSQKDFEFRQNEYALCAQLCQEMINFNSESVQLQQHLSALQETIEQNYEQYDKNFQLNEQTQGYLHSLGFNPVAYLNLHGTAMQQQLHAQTCEIFDQAATLQRNLQHDSNILKQSVLFADAAHSANMAEQIRLTISLNHVAEIPLFNFCNDVAVEFTRLGTIAAEQFAHSALHALNPVEIVHGISSILQILIDPFRVNNAYESKNNPLEEMQNFSYMLQVKNQQRRKAAAQCLYNTLSSLNLWYEQRPLQEKSEDVLRGFVDVGTNFVVPDIVISKIATAIGCVAVNMRAMRTLEGCASGLGEQLGFEEMAQELSQLTHELEAATQENIGQKITAEFMEIEGQEHHFSRYKIIPLKTILEELRRYKGCVPIFEKELIAQAQYWFEKIIPQANAKIDKATLQKFKTLKKVFDNQEVDLYIHAKHIANFEIIAKTNKLKTHVEFKLMGGHLSGSCKNLEEFGLVNIKSSAPLRHGCKEYILEDLITGLEFKKTEFPKHWDMDRILTSISEAFDNPIKADVPIQNSRILRKGINREGVEIEVIIDPKPLLDKYGKPVRPHDMTIITAYPYFKK